MGRKLRAGLMKTAALCLPVLLGGCKMVLLDPKGQIGLDERNLIFLAVGLMLLVVVPVIFMALFFAWHYRASNKKATYKPEWDYSGKIESVVWGVPILIIVVLGYVTWKSTHELEPSNPIDTAVKPLHVEVVSLDWKWLFIYPEQGIATVNELAFPVNMPVKFDITSATVMNSFFIPQIGSQIYAMAGMDSKLHLISDKVGTYFGLSSDFSGKGFYGMHFNAKVMTKADFDAWVAAAKKSPNQLTAANYAKLAQPSENVAPEAYSAVDPTLFQTILFKYMKPGMKTPTKAAEKPVAPGAAHVG
jgi:cytochrome o ubiquinol oxidase subunit 2